MSNKSATVPIVQFIKNTVKQFHANNEREKLRKIRFLTEHTFDYYLKSQPEIKLSEVDLPYFIYSEQQKKYAYDRTLEEMTKVIEECRVNQCYKNCVKELQKVGMSF